MRARSSGVPCDRSLAAYRSLARCRRACSGKTPNRRRSSTKATCAADAPCGRPHVAARQSGRHSPASSQRYCLRVKLPHEPAPNKIRDGTVALATWALVRSGMYRDPKTRCERATVATRPPARRASSSGPKVRAVVVVIPTCYRQAVAGHHGHQGFNCLRRFVQQGRRLICT